MNYFNMIQFCLLQLDNSPEPPNLTYDEQNIKNSAWKLTYGVSHGLYQQEKTM